MSLRGALAALVLAATPALADGRAGDFDFYVLSLSWSPTYCTTDDNPDTAQCDGSPRAFVVHGLWPQYETGYPDYCASSQPRGLKPSTLATIAKLMPSENFARYEWRKHGLCSGLDEETYFGLVMRAAAAVIVPREIATLTKNLHVSPAGVETAFIAANPGLSPAGVAVECRRGRLSEVRVCFTKDLAFRRCSEVDDDACGASMITVPPVR